VAEDLVKIGHEVTAYEAWPVPGGVLIYGIPSFKLDKKIVLDKIQDLEDAGVKFITNTRIGEAITVDDLLEEYDAVFLGTGAAVEATMNIPGEDLKGIYKATDYLVRANVPTDMLPQDMREAPVVGQRVAVIGGGDTAVDCARTSVRLGAEEVTIVYRRTEAEMPGNKTERYICIDEGVDINYLQAPVEFIGDDNGHVKAMKVIKMKLGEPDSSGRRRPVPIEGSEFIQEIDNVILAIGYWPDPFVGEKTKDLATHNWGLIVTDKEVGATSREGVFAAGDNAGDYCHCNSPPGRREYGYLLERHGRQVGGSSAAPREEVSLAAVLTHQIEIDLMLAHAAKVELPNAQDTRKFRPTKRFLLRP
jgi:glutamate synthase (NADPH/NADH) small chain